MMNNWSKLWFRWFVRIETLVCEFVKFWWQLCSRTLSGESAFQPEREVLQRCSYAVGSSGHWGGTQRGLRRCHRSSRSCASCPWRCHCTWTHQLLSPICPLSACPWHQCLFLLLLFFRCIPLQIGLIFRGFGVQENLETTKECYRYFYRPAVGKIHTPLDRLWWRRLAWE